MKHKFAAFPGKNSWRAWKTSAFIYMTIIWQECKLWWWNPSNIPPNGIMKVPPYLSIFCSGACLQIYLCNHWLVRHLPITTSNWLGLNIMQTSLWNRCKRNWFWRIICTRANKTRKVCRELFLNCKKHTPVSLSHQTEPCTCSFPLSRNDSQTATMRSSCAVLLPTHLDKSCPGATLQETNGA